MSQPSLQVDGSMQPGCCQWSMGVIPPLAPAGFPETQAPCSVVLQQLAALFPRIPSRREGPLGGAGGEET